MTTKFSDYRNPAILIPSANPDILLGNEILCEISSVRFNVVYVSLCREVNQEDGEKQLLPVDIPYSVSLTSGSGQSMDGISPTSNHQRVRIPINKGRASFSINIGVTDDKLISREQFRLVAFETPTAEDPFIQSCIFRARKYRLHIVLSATFPPAGGKFYYEGLERMLRFQVELLDHAGAKVKACAQFQCDIYDKNGVQCNDQITRPAWDDWWAIESKSSEDDYELPCEFRFGCRNSVHTEIQVRVSVVKVTFPPGISADQIGSAETTPFFVYSKPPNSSKKRTRQFDIKRDDAVAESIEELGYFGHTAADNSDMMTAPDRYYADMKHMKAAVGDFDENPKSVLKIWMDLAIAALTDVYSATSIENIDKIRMFNVLFGFHAWQVEKCVVSSEAGIPMRGLNDDLVTLYNMNGAAAAKSAFASGSPSQQSGFSARVEGSSGGGGSERSNSESTRNLSGVADKDYGSSLGSIYAALSRRSDSLSSSSAFRTITDQSSQSTRSVVNPGSLSEGGYKYSGASMSSVSNTNTGTNSFGEMASRVHDPAQFAESNSNSFNLNLFQDRNSFSTPGIPMSSMMSTENPFLSEIDKWESARSLCELSSSTSLEQIMENPSHNFLDLQSLGGSAMSMSSLNIPSLPSSSGSATHTNYVEPRRNSFSEGPSTLKHGASDSPSPPKIVPQMSNQTFSQPEQPKTSAASSGQTNLPPKTVYVCWHKFKDLGLPVYDASYYLLGFVRLEDYSLLFVPDPKNLKNYEYDRLKGQCFANATDTDIIWTVSHTPEFRERLIARIATIQ